MWLDSLSIKSLELMSSWIEFCYKSMYNAYLSKDKLLFKQCELKERIESTFDYLTNLLSKRKNHLLNQLNHICDTQIHGFEQQFIHIAPKCTKLQQLKTQQKK